MFLPMLDISSKPSRDITKERHRNAKEHTENADAKWNGSQCGSGNDISLLLHFLLDLLIYIFADMILKQLLLLGGLM